jgi:SAM-dependent methyltransferase
MCSAENKPYYLAYESRYKSVYAQGADRYGLPDDEEKIRLIVLEYVAHYDLKGKKVVEFGCGEGIAAQEFARLDSLYTGYDISPTAIEKASALISGFPRAKLFVKDAVLGHFPDGAFDAGIDISFLHLLILYIDRRRYLKNVFNSLKHGSPMYFVHAIYNNDAYQGEVTDYEHWLKIFGDNVVVPRLRKAQKDGREISVELSLIPYRPRTEQDYRDELESAGFQCLDFSTSDLPDRANILAMKM